MQFLLKINFYSSLIEVFYYICKRHGLHQLDGLDQTMCSTGALTTWIVCVLWKDPSLYLEKYNISIIKYQFVLLFYDDIYNDTIYFSLRTSSTNSYEVSFTID